MAGPMSEFSSPLDMVPRDTLRRAETSESDGMVINNFNAYAANIQLAGMTGHPDASHDAALGLLKGLHIKTDVPLARKSASSYSIESESRLRQSASAASLPRHVRAALSSSAGSHSPNIVMTSPQIAAMVDITPLPSPTLTAHESWKAVARTRSRSSSTASRTDIPAYAITAASLSPTSPPPRRKVYHGLRPTTDSLRVTDARSLSNDGANDPRNRSVSEYIPEALAVPKPRNIAVSSTGPPPDIVSAQTNMHREEYLGLQRGHEMPITKPKTPPGTTAAQVSSDEGSEPASKRAKVEVYTAQSISSGQRRRYASIRQLGQGTFSKVYLAVRQIDGENDKIDYTRDSTNMAGVRMRSRRLVAIKVVQHGPAGGADADRVKVSLQREVELMKAVHHPSLVHLKAFGSADEGQALLVMNYCPGGDLFEVASTRLDILVPSLIRRVFSELVSAVRYLHKKHIVHRDIKLENVLLNIPIQVLPDVSNWQTLDRAVVTLTDLGLSRRIPEPPESPLLTTRCGSEDYAAPELLMGQPYDGRQTDAWALGVLLYALMEGRLPFDPLPGARGDPVMLRARTPHRIARYEWAWCKYGDEDGDWDAEKGKDLEDAFTCVDGLLKRSSRRKPLDEIAELPWVRHGIQVELRRAEEETM